MLTLLAPALAGLGAALVLLPVALHLWSRRPARVVDVGSIVLLAGAQPSQARRLSPSDWPLLLLRMAIVLCAALAAGGLAWRGGALGRRTVALVDPAVDGAVQLADSLAGAGRAVHWLVPGLPLREASAPPAAAGRAQALWPLLADAETQLPEADTLVVAAVRSAATVQGPRPALALPIQWLEVTDSATARADSVTLCVQRDADVEETDLRRFAAALTVAGDVTGIAVTQRSGTDCRAGVVRLVTTTPPTGALSDGPFRLDPQLGEWRLAVSQLNEPSLADAIIARLGLRARERAAQTVSQQQALPVRQPAAEAPRQTQPLAYVPALLALALLIVERIVAGRARPAGAARA